MFSLLRICQTAVHSLLVFPEGSLTIHVAVAAFAPQAEVSSCNTDPAAYVARNTYSPALPESVQPLVSGHCLEQPAEFQTSSRALVGVSILGQRLRAHPGKRPNPVRTGLGHR